jgi:hypothetical protein
MSAPPTDNPKYDVAISFLAKDEPIAGALHDELAKSLDVFFFPRNQEELAGTDGLESMRAPSRRLQDLSNRPRIFFARCSIGVARSHLATISPSFPSVIAFVTSTTLIRRPS